MKSSTKNQNRRLVNYGPVSSKLKGGLTLLTIQDKKNTSTFRVSILFKVGSRDDPRHLNGISHFVEHACFLGSENYPSRDQIDKAFLELSGRYDASTSREVTTYECTGKASKLSDAVHLLLDMTFQPLFNQGLDEERRVIFAELSETTDERGRLTNTIDIAFKALMPEYGDSMPVVGNRASLRRIKMRELLNHHAKFYRPENAVITVISPFKHDAVKRLVEKIFMSLAIKETSSKSGKYHRLPRFGGDETSRSRNLKRRQLRKKKKDIVTTFTTGSSLVSIELFLAISESSSAKKRAAIFLLLFLLLESESSLLFGDVRRKGISYALLGELIESDFYNVWHLSSEVPEKEVGTFLDILGSRIDPKLIVDFDRELFSLLKERMMFELKSQISDSHQYIDDFAIGILLGGGIPQKEEMLKEVSSLSKKDVVSALDLFLKAERRCIVIGGQNPSSQKGRARKLIERLKLKGKKSSH